MGTVSELLSPSCINTEHILQLDPVKWINRPEPPVFVYLAKTELKVHWVVEAEAGGWGARGQSALQFLNIQARETNPLNKQKR